MLMSCSSDDASQTTINGRVQRALNGVGVADHSVTVMTRKATGSGLFSTIKELDRQEIVTDINGDFSVDLESDQDAFVTIVHQGDDDYSGTGIYTDYSLDELVIIEVDKYIKFKISITHTNPFDENDFIKVGFFAGLSNVVTTAIENFGIDNTYIPVEQLPGGGSIGPVEETSWTGIDVNSNIYYSVPESATHFKIRWYMTKNGVHTDGFSSDIPYDNSEINSFVFDY
ncbi:hypothetical protein GCM10008085_14500 [Winogradskyella epiphytica]|nr:hypothetical protein GCM10008085_14500 [Winogradskyella epiphytica]